jgi:hypothetical protein
MLRNAIVPNDNQSMTFHATIQPFYSLYDVLTDQHVAEALSRAHVRAIAGRAGLNLAIREYDL